MDRLNTVDDVTGQRLGAIRGGDDDCHVGVVTWVT